MGCLTPLSISKIFEDHFRLLSLSSIKNELSEVFRVFWWSVFSFNATTPAFDMANEERPQNVPHCLSWYSKWLEQKSSNQSIHFSTHSLCNVSHNFADTRKKLRLSWLSSCFLSSLLIPPHNSCLISPDSSVWRGLIPVALLAPGYQSSARSRSHRCLRVSDLSVVSCTQPTAVADWAAELCSICVPMHKDALSCPLALLTLTYTFIYGRRSLVFPGKVTTTMKVPISNDDIRDVFKTERQRHL